MTIEERIEVIKNHARSRIFIVRNHKLGYMPDDGGFDETINMMHTAQTKEDLIKALNTYINICISHNYDDGDIIAGIMQNEDKNTEFGIDIDSVIKHLIKVRNSSINTNENNTEATVSINENNTKEFNFKAPLDGLSVDEIRKYAKQYVPGAIAANEFGSTEEDINNGDLFGHSAAIRKAAYDWVKNHSEKSSEKVAESNYAKNRANDEKGNAKMNENKSVVNEQPKVVEQAAVAHNENGFNINNFIKQAPGPATISTHKKLPMQQKFVFPHEISGKTDEEIIAENAKHFQLIPGSMISAYALYDLNHNKQLKNKMKEYDSKHRPNNLIFTQVNINEYIGDAELLAKYPLCFTTPCNDKGYVIVVLFNPIPEVKPDGYVQYPMHLIKAKLTNPDNK